MSQQFDAIYDNGVLRPLVPLPLPDKARVRLTVEAQSGTGEVIQAQDEWELAVLGIAKDCGVSLPDSALGSEGLYE